MISICVKLIPKQFEAKFIKKLCNTEAELRSSRPEMFCKRGVLRNFAKFTGKHLYQSLFFSKVAGLQLYLKRDSGTGVFL